MTRALATAVALVSAVAPLAHARTATVSGTWPAVKRAATLDPGSFRLELTSLGGAETVPGVILTADTLHFGRRAGRLGACEMAGAAYDELLAMPLPLSRAEARAVAAALDAQPLAATHLAERDQARLGLTAGAGRRRRACFGLRVPPRLAPGVMRALQRAVAGNPAALEALQAFTPTVTDTLI